MQYNDCFAYLGTYIRNDNKPKPRGKKKKRQQIMWEHNAQSPLLPFFFSVKCVKGWFVFSLKMGGNGSEKRKQRAGESEKKPK